ncbi:hypothetical protein C8Q79DRAFT_499452 [Trametes meyenii]|nr:hypothetical protein C8Q79DRAFT_499452 [Trametes meyenii]
MCSPSDVRQAIIPHCKKAKFSAVSRTSLIVADAIVIVVTIMRTWKKSTGLVKISRIASFRDILLYNGIKYFIVLCCLNMLSVVLTRLSIFGEISQEGSYVTILSEPYARHLSSRRLLDCATLSLMFMGQLDGYSHLPVPPRPPSGETRYRIRVSPGCGGHIAVRHKGHGIAGSVCRTWIWAV